VKEVKVDVQEVKVDVKEVKVDVQEVKVDVLATHDIQCGFIIEFCETCVSDSIYAASLESAA